MTDRDVVFVIGTRPEIIKTAPVIEECQRRGLSKAVIHTGQHYSESLDNVFFDQLDLDPPDVNLEIGSGKHGAQTGQMLAGVEKQLEVYDPETVLVQGDTNSTLAGALAATKLDIDVAHIEAGLRSFDRTMPEETNRVIVDHVADYLYPPTEENAHRLRDEGLPTDRITVTGNTIVDAVTTYDEIAATTSTVLADLGIEPDEFALLTAHRAETVDKRDSFESILQGVAHAAERLDTKVIYPVHPRAQDRLDKFGLTIPENIRTIDPLAFFDFLRLESAAALAFTDSGGVQEETCILGTPCVTLRYGTERPGTATVGANCIAGHDPVDIVDAAITMSGKTGDWEAPFGDGDASKHILSALPLETSERVVEAVD
jgi:UDP-N-acetylglucosamine 2-epimerase (non-hydrolysing)